MLAGIRPRARWLVIVVAAHCMVALALSSALAQGPRSAAPAVVRARPPGRSAARRGSVAGDAGSPVTGPGAAQGGGASAGPGDAGVVESKSLDGGTHVFKFSELDIEGRLKSPQLVYFLRRVRAEFSAGELGHRSFMREMSETRKEGSFQ